MMMWILASADPAAVGEYRQTIEHQGEPEPAPESAPGSGGGWLTLT
jgi:hypothetical protein